MKVGVRQNDGCRIEKLWQVGLLSVGLVCWTFDVVWAFADGFELSVGRSVAVRVCVV
jgi:hypothetical protein